MFVCLASFPMPLFHVGFICKGYVWEKVSVKTQGKLKTKAIFAGSLRVSFSWSDACALHMIGRRKVRIGWRQLVFASVSQVTPSRETPAKQSVLPDCHTWYTLSLPTLYIPPLSTYVDECFWEKTLATNIESWRLLYPQFSTQLLADFPQLLHLHFHTIERLIAQTLITPF